jgi:hypothetical protein
VATADGKQRTARRIYQTGNENNNNSNEDNVQHMEDRGFTVMLRLHGDIASAVASHICTRPRLRDAASEMQYHSPCVCSCRITPAGFCTENKTFALCTIFTFRMRD